MEEEYLQKLEQIQFDYEDDIEIKHIKEDELLCELLSKLGYCKVVDYYQGTRKWYA